MSAGDAERVPRSLNMVVGGKRDIWYVDYVGDFVPASIDWTLTRRLVSGVQSVERIKLGR